METKNIKQILFEKEEKWPVILPAYMKNLKMITMIIFIIINIKDENEFN